MYKILLNRQPTNYYKKCPAPIARRLNKCLTRLQENPFGPGTKKLEGELRDFRRIRAGGIRVVYRVDEAQKLVMVISILPRGDVYK